MSFPSAAFLPLTPLPLKPNPTFPTVTPHQHRHNSSHLPSSPRKRARIHVCAHQPSAQSPPSDTANSPTLPNFRPFRKLLVSLSLLGTIETAYLTLVKLFSSPGAICSSQGCLDVLTGPFSSFLGIPLTLFGTLAYTAFAYLCIYPLAADAELDSDGNQIRSMEQVYAARDVATRPLLLALSSAMMAYSAYLMAILLFVLKEMCPYCIVSACISTSLFVITLLGRAVPSWIQTLKVTILSAGFSSVAAIALFFTSMPAQLRAQPTSPQSPPEITMRSDKDSLRIANKLGAKKTKMYGAYWCSHCYDQKQRFGKKAFSKIEYIECDKFGVNSRYQLCRDKRIAGYPTWEIDGELYAGEIELGELERLADGN